MKKYFLTGLVALLPVAVTVWVVHFFVNFLTKPFIGIVYIFTEKLPIQSVQVTKTISQIIILICLVVLTFVVGFVARRFFFHQILKFSDHFLNRIPIVNKVYKTTKEIVKSIFDSKERSFKQVVMLPFPYEGSFCIGLIAKNAPITCSEGKKEELVSVFIPTTPNPSTGFLVMCHLKDLILLDMKPEEAIKYVVSCAVIQPKVKQ